MPGTLCSLQHWRLNDGSTLLSCKPLTGTNCLDLMGQYRQASARDYSSKPAEMKAYIASKKRILVHTKEKLLLAYDENGYNKDIPAEIKNKKVEIMEHTIYNQVYGRFFLIKVKENSKLTEEDYKLLQCIDEEFEIILSGDISDTFLI